MSNYKFAIEAKHLNKTYNKKKVNALVDFNIEIALKINMNTAPEIKIP